MGVRCLVLVALEEVEPDKTSVGARGTEYEGAVSLAKWEYSCMSSCASVAHLDAQILSSSAILCFHSA